MNSLVSVEQLSVCDVEALFRSAQFYLNHQSFPKKQGSMVNLFFEPSTRTSLSFQLAARRLGIELLDFEIGNSSFKKGESLVDTIHTLEALGVDIAVIRHSEDWPKVLDVDKLNISILNAGSGTVEHPTQALLDALTIYQEYGAFKGLTVTIVGDVLHSRVAHSNAILLRKLGATVQFAGPKEFKRADVACEWVDFEEAVKSSDVVMMLRVQHERHRDNANMVDYNLKYGLNKKRLKNMSENAIILHPGPVNRNVEITDAAMDDSRCKILQQVKNGVAIRMAILDACLHGGSYGKLVSA